MYKIRGADAKEYGPVSADQVRQWINERRLDARSPIQEVGTNVWKPLSEYPEFSANLGGAARPPVLDSPNPPTSGTSSASKAVRPPVSGLAIASLVLGVLSFCTWVTAIPGIIVSALALRKIRKNRGLIRGRGLAVAGLVTSILAFVIVPGIFLPAISKRSRMQGGDPTGECMAHIEQLSRIVRMYANDNNDTFPPAATWCDAIQRDVIDSGVFQCPARPGLRSGFAFNAAVAGRKDQDVNPATVMLFESDAGWNASGGAESVVSPPLHRGSIMVAFADGSVRQVPASEVPGLQWKP